MNEFRIIFKRPISFISNLIAVGCLTLAPSLDAIKDRDNLEIGPINWAIMVCSVAGAMAVAARAWFSTSAATARSEIEQENGGSNVKD